LPLLINHNVTSGTIRLIQFTVGSSVEVGAITTNGSTTTYGTTSDYRLKQDLQDYNALSLISNIKTFCIILTPKLYQKFLLNFYHG
jgi:hypothetical protein